MHHFLKLSGNEFLEQGFLEGFDKWIKEIKAGTSLSKQKIDLRIFCEGKLTPEKMNLLNHFRQKFPKLKMTYQIKISEWDRNIWDFISPTDITLIIDDESDNILQVIKEITQEVRGARVIVKTLNKQLYEKIMKLNLVNTKVALLKKNNKEEVFAPYSYPLSIISSHGFLSNLEAPNEVYYFMNYLGEFLTP